MGRPAEPEPSLTLHSLLLPVFLAEFTKFSRRRRPCCSRGTQLALLALVTTALWAGLLTLLLLWREDTPNPRDPISCSLPDPHSQVLGSPISLISPPWDTSHPKPPSPAGRWGVDGWEHPKYILSLLSSPSSTPSPMLQTGKTHEI